uniref:Uncharacterized protein n=1 Tax=Chromera velia CCMP2878 TaxID=1169474 RepID=A0A0G4HI28_9ALVE|eukprot:Cvel_27702.t1-p1 / transcript=Cvel_27702.t1 / gene=Cvel_27702 / organism=Chromera_velia_CCMP2878 / gene_product=Zinc finger protein 283, putative / transcript_product=Zinc finger protein 283, putative / location=Cvel_scaffold3499:14359-15288(-) / protein_length=310 / sequence_SO=supercontig / SO=protein_coding / is_pseudo=false
MSWENYGSHWHIDHIIPIMYPGVNSQRPDVRTQIARLHFSNLQPLWSAENLRKGNRFIGKPAPIPASQKPSGGLQDLPKKNHPLQSILLRPLALSPPFHPTCSHNRSIHLRSVLKDVELLSTDTEAACKISETCSQRGTIRETGIGKADVSDEVGSSVESAFFASELSLAEKKPVKRARCPHGRQRSRCKECEGKESVNMVAGARSVNSVEDRVFTSTVAVVDCAKNVGERDYVSTDGSEVSARSAEGRAFANTVASGIRAGTVGGRASASMVARRGHARSVEEKTFANTADDEISARSVGGAVSVHTGA